MRPAARVFVDRRAALHEPRRLAREIDEQQRDGRIHEQVADRVEQVVAREIGQHERARVGDVDERLERAVGARLPAAVRAIAVARRIRGRDDQERLRADERDRVGGKGAVTSHGSVSVSGCIERRRKRHATRPPASDTHPACLRRAPPRRHCWNFERSARRGSRRVFRFGAVARDTRAGRTAQRRAGRMRGVWHASCVNGHAQPTGAAFRQA